MKLLIAISISSVLCAASTTASSFADLQFLEAFHGHASPTPNKSIVDDTQRLNVTRYHHDDKHEPSKLDARDMVINGQVIDTILATDTNDIHWHVAVWDHFDCTGPAYGSYTDPLFISAGCKKMGDGIKSFAMKGNIKPCTTYWYWDHDCSDPAEMSSTFGDIWCQKAPGGPGQEQLGSFKIMCPA